MSYPCISVADVDTYTHEMSSSLGANPTPDAASGDKRKAPGHADGTIQTLFSGSVPPLSKSNMGLQSSAHVEDTGHDDAAVITTSFGTAEVDGSVFVDPSPNSVLLAKLGRRDEFRYQTEAGIQVLVIAALEDALKSQGIKGLFDVYPEASLFSYRPDIVVVHHSVLGIALLVEIKKPGHTVFTEHQVGGQVFDYLMGMRSSGIVTPFAVLSTYDQMCIAHLNDDGKSLECLREEAKHRHEKFQAATILGRAIPALGSTLSKESAVLNADISPDSGVNKVFGRSFVSAEEHENNGDKTEEEDESDGDDESDDSSYNREVHYSETFSGTHIMNALVLALRCGIKSMATYQPRMLPVDGGCIPAGGACALANEEGVVWKDFPRKITFNYIDFPDGSTKNFYLWRNLGRGSTGRVFLACSETGRACAAKVFLLDETIVQRSPRSARAAIRDALLEENKKDAEAEMKHWEALYGGTFKQMVRVVKMNKLWCLLMPFFDAITINERADHLPRVKEHMIDFKNKNLKYKDNDLQWRHVGVRDGKTFLIDLGSLVKCNAEDIDVDAQVAKLERRR
jgi:hypothetical protein